MESAPLSEELEQERPKAGPPQAAPRSPRLVPQNPVGFEANARLTLFFVASIFCVTFFAWGGAKAACNHHPASYQAFKPTSLDRLAAAPKGAALEFQHRLFTGDFAGARELALPEALPLVVEAERACDASCKASISQRQESAATRSTLMNRSQDVATAKVESSYQEQKLVSTYELKFDKPIWKVFRRIE